MEKYHIPVFTEKDINRFWSKILIGTVTECWNWQTKTIDKDGYGRMSVKGLNLRSNRIAYYLFTGLNPKELSVCHKCDNPKCCNPHHLFLGSALENRIDCVNKNRQAKGENHGTKTKPESLAFALKNGHYTKPEATPKGESHWKSKVSSSDINRIKEEYKEGGITQQKLADKYGVTQVHISYIINNKTWRHLKTA